MSQWVNLYWGGGAALLALEQAISERVRLSVVFTQR